MAIREIVASIFQYFIKIVEKFTFDDKANTKCFIWIEIEIPCSVSNCMILIYFDDQNEAASVTNEKLFHVNSSRLHFGSFGDNVI